MGWYLLGTIIPMGVGFFKTPIFTRYFTPEEYGYLGIVTITFSYVSIFLYSWLSGCLWRYYNAYKNNNDLKNLFSNMFLIYLGASLVLLAGSVIAYFLVDNTIVKKLIILSFVQYFIKEIISLYLIIVRLEGKAFTYNILHSLRAILSFALLYVLTFGYHYRITSVLTSSIIIDILALVVIVFIGFQSIRISYKAISRSTQKILIRFGSVGLIANFCFLLITSSDRYIIALFSDMATVGIYNQVYNICQLSVVAILTVFFNTVNPKLNKELEINLVGSDPLLSKYLSVLLIFGLPLITYLSLFSKEVADILLGEEFRSGYNIMPFIFISAFFYGLFLLIEIKFKFADKLKNIASGVIIASILNIGLNFVFIPLYGYKWAAITTLIAYLFILVYFYSQDTFHFFSQSNNIRTMMIIIAILSVQVMGVIFLRNYVELNIWQTILEGFLLLLIYLLIMRKEILKLQIPV